MVLNLVDNLSSWQDVLVTTAASGIGPIAVFAIDLQGQVTATRIEVV